MTDHAFSRNKSQYFEIKNLIKEKVLSTSAKRMWNLETNINKELEKIGLCTSLHMKTNSPYVETTNSNDGPFDKNLANTLFQPKTSRQLVQEISRKINEKNKFVELQNYFKKIQNDKLPKVKNEETQKKKKKNMKVLTGRRDESPKKGSQNFIFSGITREKRSKLLDPENCSPPIGHYKPCYKLIHNSSSSNVKFIKPRDEPEINLDQESEKEFKHLNKLLKNTIESQATHEEEQK